MLAERGMKLKGSYVVKVRDSVTGELKRTLGPIQNLIVNSTGYGYDLITRALGGDPSYQLTIDSAKIGTGSASVTSADTDLATPSVSDISLALSEYIAPAQVRLTFYMTDGQLPNGTYREFGIYANSRLFARSLFSPALTKGSNENITVEYTLDFS